MEKKIKMFTTQPELDFVSEMQFKIDRLKLQRSRIYEATGIYAVHDADFYIVLLRRMYRDIEETASSNSAVANLKGQHKEFLLKIKIRDDFEHPPETPSKADKKILLEKGIINEESTGEFVIQTSIIRQNESILIVSGKNHWDLEDDHKQFLKLFEKFIDLKLSTLQKSKTINMD